MDSKTCAFTGNRPQKLPFGFDESSPECLRLKSGLLSIIEKLITHYGVTHFLSGMALGIDQWAAEAVIALREMYPTVTLHAVIPCANQEIRWSPAQRARYIAILQRCNQTIVLQQAYHPGCMQARNCYLVDNSDILLAVWAGGIGGTKNTLEYAQAKQKKIVRLHPNGIYINSDI